MFQLALDLIFSGKINTVVNLLNIGVLFVGALFLLRAIYALIRNNGELQRLDRKLKKMEKLPERGEMIQLITGSGMFSSRGILNTLIRALESLSETSMEDKDKLIQLESIRNETRSAIPRAVPGLAVSIGFLGTVIGLFIAISAMANSEFIATEEGLNSLLASMAGALGGMHTAFATTIIGLINSLILTIGNLSYRIFWGRYDHTLQRLLTLKIYPLFIIPDEENIVKYLIGAVEASQDTMRTIVNSNNRLLGSVDNLTQNMEQYNSENEKIISQVTRVVKEFLKTQKGNKTVFESINNIAHQVSQSYNRVEGLLDTAHQDREAYLAYLQDSRDEIKEISVIQHKAYEESNNGFLKKQQEINEENHRNFVKTNNEIHTILQQASEHLTKNVNNTNVKLEELLKNLDLNLKGFTAKIVENNTWYGNETKQLIGKLSALVQKSIETNNFYVEEYKV